MVVNGHDRQNVGNRRRKPPRKQIPMRLSEIERSVLARIAEHYGLSEAAALREALYLAAERLG